MREILFKAKRIDNGEWVEGYLVETRHNTYHDGYRIIDKDGINYDELDYYEPSFISYVIDKTTICQCTGLKDKNNKLIWENDIVKHDFGEDQIGVQLAIVKYDSKYACYQIKPIYDWMYCDKSDCEVIGNIFDNPELMHE